MLRMPPHSPSVLAHVGENLRKARLEAGMSQAALAERSGISRRTIVNVEAGEANISLTGVDHLATALGTTFTALVSAPGAVSTAIDEIAWHGDDPASTAVLHSSVPARAETQLWSWALGPGDRYDARPDPSGWHEILVVTSGTLLLTRAGAEDAELRAGAHITFSTSQPYAYVNASGTDAVEFIRVVVN